MKTKVKMALTAAALVSSATVATVAMTAHAADADKGQCHGINSCKGQTACATAEGSCAGTNSCKGKGWMAMDKKACNAKGGTFKPLG